MASKASDVIALFGGQSALARALGLNQSTVQHWAKTGQIPSWRREQVLRAAQQRGIAVRPGDLANGGGREAIVNRGPAMGFVRAGVPASPAPPAPPAPQAPAAPAPMPLAHGRADTIPQTDWEIGALRAEIGQLRELVEKLLREVAALREADRRREADAAEASA